MKTGRIAAAIGMMVGGTLIVRPLPAQTAPFPTLARSYSAWMARAMDQCNPAVVSVISPASPPGAIPSSGCLQANGATTDTTVSPGATMSWARVVVKATRTHLGKIALTGKGFHGGQRMQVSLSLRVTKANQATKHPPATNSSVTFKDIEIHCGNNATTGCFTANLRGGVAASMALSDCLAQNSQPGGLAQGNIEILDSALLNCDTGKVIGKPGMLIK